MALVALAHLCGALGWLVLSPRGFPVLHAKTLANIVLPLAVVLLGIVGLLGSRPGADRWAAAAWLAWTVLWITAAATALWLYPSGLVRLALLCAVPCGVLVAGSAAGVLAHRTAMRSRRALALGVFGAVIGVSFPLAQRAEPPSTRPAGGDVPPPARESAGDAVVDLGGGVSLTRDGHVVARADGSVVLRPALRFRSRSPDGGWTLFSPARLQRTAELADVLMTAGGGRAAWTARSVGRHHVEVTRSLPDRIEIDARSALPDAVYSHLNTWLAVELAQPHARWLALRFAPCPERSFPIDDPGGSLRQQATFAAFHDDATLRVLRASAGEKGPFEELARGPLRRGEPLTIEVERGGVAWLRPTVLDFSAQCSTELSPTAGWGVPQNAIEWWDRGDGRAILHFSLAGTSVGRGYDSVGHATGVYRNRVIVERSE